MDAKYNPTDIEAKWYQYWQDQNSFTVSLMAVNHTP